MQTRSLYYCEHCGTKKGNIRLDGYAYAFGEDKTCRCHKCGRDAKLSQKQIDTVHFACADPGGFAGPDGRTWRIACNPAAEAFGMFHHTDNAEAVTCSDCVKSDMHQDLIRQQRAARPIMLPQEVRRR